MKGTWTFILFFFGLFMQHGFSQDLNISDTIHLRNSSFEDMSRPSKAPTAWWNCGAKGESPPDVQPGAFLNQFPAYQGETYLGMVTRVNETVEAVGQQLRMPLQPGTCYSFSLLLARATTYKSPKQANTIIALNSLTDSINHEKPVKLRIWGSNQPCRKGELLDETPLVENYRWKQYNFRFEPKQRLTYLIIEAYYKTPVLIPYAGNVLVDAASAIVVVPCEEELLADITEPASVPAPIAEASKPPRIVNVPPPPKTRPTPTQEEPIVTAEPPLPEPKVRKPKPKQERIMKDLDRRKLREGLTLKIEKLNFPADSARITDTSFEVLDEIYDFLSDNRDVNVEIGGYTNNRCDTKYCDWLSEKRAKAIADYLIGKGIREERLSYKGYGKRNPIATNRTPSGRKQNQRVEIKIISMDG